MKQPASDSTANHSQAGPHAVGFVLLLVAVGATLMLVLQHIAGLALPGCGPGGACAEAARSVWGKVPVIHWPVSFVGFAYFLGLLVAWFVAATAGVSQTLRWLVRLGVVVSVVYVIVLAIGKHSCIYCIVAHAANFAFWLLLESRGKTVSAAARPLAALCGTFVIASLALGAADWRQRMTVEARGNKELAESVQKIADAAGRKPTSDSGSTIGVGTTTTPGPKDSSRARWPNGFTSRHRKGPDNAPIRIVVLSDFQCPDCKRTDEEIARMLEVRKDVSFAFKHFPMCKDCNPRINMTLHGNACWAARASEAAAFLHGEEGFWQMHRWLFDNKGMFDNKTFEPALQSMGYNPKEFISLMSADERTLRPVQADCEDGFWLGLFYTPMVFINGVELKGVFTPNAVPRAVEMLAVKNPPPMTCASDFPPPAYERYLSDWRDQFVRQIPASPKCWPLGPEDARVRVVVWGELQESNTAQVDEIIRKFMAGRSDTYYEFRPYPVNPKCNSFTQADKFPKSCLAHKAAMAAGLLGGSDGYWKMHTWLTSHQASLDEESLKQNAHQMGFDVPKLLGTMESQEVAAIINKDAETARNLNLTAVPTVYVNGKFVPRWLRDTESVLEPIMLEAGR